MHLYHFAPRSGLDDDRLRQLVSDPPERCIILMEDIDVAFHRTLNREPKGSKIPRNQSARISLSGLLNALDGVGAKEGRLLFATANRYEALDAALRRPGRIDYLVEFKLASQRQAGELFKKFYPPTPRTSPHEDPTTSEDGAASEELDVLAGQFKELIPEEVFSIDALLGYLMMHKDQPRRAVDGAGKWVLEMASRKEG